MASKPPDWVDPGLLPSQPSLIQQLTQGPQLSASPSASPSFTSNGTWGRVITRQCYADHREERLAELQKRLADHANGTYPMTPEQSLATRAEVLRLAESINPGGQSLTATPSAAEQAVLDRQAAANQYAANTIGMSGIGLPAFGGWIARGLGASEDTVSLAAEMTTGLTLGIQPGARGSASQQAWQAAKPNRPLLPRPGAHVDQRRWVDAEGKPVYPPNDGFAGPRETRTLQPGERIDRFGGEGGRYVSPAGESFESRALPGSSFDQPYTQYEVLKPFDVQAGRAAPWFGEPGGGMQYYTGGQTVGDLVSGGYLRPIQ